MYIEQYTPIGDMVYVEFASVVKNMGDFVAVIGWPQPSANSSLRQIHVWGFPYMGVPYNGWFITENRIKLEDLGVPPFQETPCIYIYPIYVYIYIYIHI